MQYKNIIHITIFAAYKTDIFLRENYQKGTIQAFPDAVYFVIFFLSKIKKGIIFSLRKIFHIDCSSMTY